MLTSEMKRLGVTAFSFGDVRVNFSVTPLSDDEKPTKFRTPEEEDELRKKFRAELERELNSDLYGAS